MDEGTMKDYIEDLLIERASLYEHKNLLEKKLADMVMQNHHYAKEITRLEQELARHA